jgi:LysM repeat protein
MKISSFILSIVLLFVSVISHADNVSSESKPVENPESVWAYTVNHKDSFERIYQKYLNKRANIVALSKYNHHALNKRLQPGQVINIPVEMLKKFRQMHRFCWFMVMSM